LGDLIGEINFAIRGDWTWVKEVGILFFDLCYGEHIDFLKVGIYS
jgi:hypothetical protein